MAISATAVWEFRSAGSATNGGFYKSDAGTTDYSQQNTAQLALTDIATDLAGTGLSSATGGFTAQMVGNGIYITGGAATSGWYEITAYTDTNNITIDRSAGASKTGVTGRVGGSVTFNNSSIAAMVAGNVGWIKNDGTHTLTGNITRNDASESLMILFFGYNASRGDEPTGTNRPYIDGGAYYLLLGNYINISHIRIQGSSTLVLRIGFAGTAFNCKIQNNSGTASRDACDNGGVSTTFLNCEIISDAGYGLNCEQNHTRVINCYIHDCGQRGITVSAVAYTTILHTIIDTCVIGVYLTTGRGTFIWNSVIYGNSAYGLQGTSCDGTTILNSIVATNAVGVSITDAHEGENYEDYCNFYDNTTDRENWNAGDHSVDVDPKFTNAAGGDFSLASDSTMIDAGIAIDIGVG